ncbi:hypothetical protein BJX70DRAFT_395172 [Aspergillus crustosus]
MPYSWSARPVTSTHAFTSILYLMERNAFDPNKPPTPPYTIPYVNNAAERHNTVTAEGRWSWPSLMDARDNLNTVDDQISDLYPFIEAGSSFIRICAIYSQSSPPHQPPRLPTLEVAELAMIIALGASPTAEDPFAVRAARYVHIAKTQLSDPETGLKEPELAVEIFGLYALYYLRLDQPLEAYRAIRDAALIARLSGFHQTQVKTDLEVRRRELWCAVHNLSQSICSVLGVPNDIRLSECPGVDPRGAEHLPQGEAQLVLHLAAAELCSFYSESQYQTQKPSADILLDVYESKVTHFEQLTTHSTRYHVAAYSGPGGFKNFNNRMLLIIYWCEIARSRPLLLDLAGTRLFQKPGESALELGLRDWGSMDSTERKIVETSMLAAVLAFDCMERLNLACDFCQSSHGYRIPLLGNTCIALQAPYSVTCAEAYGRSPNSVC